jgi:hypothetical protein
MSGFGTKKPGSDFIQQLTFPTLYADYYAMEHEPLAYFPDPIMRPEALPVGHDLQAAYHEQKRIDANRRAMAGVKDTATAKYRYLHSHAGYYDMPKPVLSQRKYANPSFGNQSDIYSARPAEAYVPIANMYGGVLYTAEAQRWGRQKMRERADQLNAIDVAQQGFLTGETLGQMPMRVGVEVPEGALPESVSTKAKIELVATIEGIASAVQSGLTLSSFLFSDVVKFLRLLFRWASTADVEELKEIMEYVDYIEIDLLGQQNQLAEGEDATEEGRMLGQYGQEILEIMRKVRDYLRRMIGVANKSPAERKAASANFIRAIGFTKTNLSAPTAEQIRRKLKDTQRAEAQAAALDDDDAYDYSDDPVFAPTETRYAIGAETPKLMARLNRSMGRLTGRKIRTRPRPARFDPSVRERMGAANGAYEGEALPEGVDGRVRNPMRNMAEAELQPEVVERGLEEEEEAPRAASAYTKPAYLSRDTIPRGDREIRQLLQRLNREGHGLYIPRDDTPVKTIRRRIIALWKL